IDCASAAGSWLPATSNSPDSSIQQEIGLNQAFAANNGLTSFDSHTLVTGEHSGLENPNMPTALQATGITTFAEDASRQPQQYALGGALGSPRYPSNIYYNASNWPDQLNEYNTLYVQQGDSIGNGEVGHCVNTAVTTCRTTPATEADVLAAESRIMLGHVLANNPRVGYAHQSNLIGPATQNGQDYGYTVLDLISNMQSQYNSWYDATSTPINQMTDTSEAQVLAEQSAWAQAESGGNYSASVTNGTVTVTNNGAPVRIPVTVPTGTTVNGAAFGQAYGGQRSDWVNLGTNGTVTLTENVPPAITSSASATASAGAAFTFTVTTTGLPAPKLTESGALPAGLTFTDNGDGTATIAGTPAAGSGGSYPITITAANAAGTVSQKFTLADNEAPAITSSSSVTFYTGISASHTITTTGYPNPALTETGALPTGLTFTDNSNGTGTISGTPPSGSAGSYPVTISASNGQGNATQNLTITVSASAAPSITSAASATFAPGTAGTFTVTTTGSPTAALAAASSPALPSGVTFKDNGNGTATISGTPPAGSQGTYAVTITASNPVGTVSQAFRLTVSTKPAFTSAATV
ncbi:MAG: putative Ig domain-containing protein, partial [Actinobacteria bacterium]|nr:putative Ig domain-containing protein [Actinomycetota bacterium]